MSEEQRFWDRVYGWRRSDWGGKGVKGLVGEKEDFIEGD